MSNVSTEKNARTPCAISAETFPRKQVHLDFHTSPDIPGIGSRFDKAQFQAALKAGHLDSITVFAKCHHGLCYYPTKVGTMHPELNFDLTGAMIDAAHEIGVRAPVYITAGWCDLDAKAHPEWIMLDKNGNRFDTPSIVKCSTRGSTQPREEVAWDTLCLNDNSYCQHIYALTEEICQRYPGLDGLFFDICVRGDACWCPECVAGMKAIGLDPKKHADAAAYFTEKRTAFMEKCGQILHRYHPHATIFFNSGGANINRPEYHPWQSHYELEDLPTCWGGYDKLPMRAKFFASTGKPTIGMTGKFHLDWGEFGGFKSADALKYEVCAMALYGAGCSVGDHMHPDGEMEMQTYENIGYAYEYLDRIAPYCYGGACTAKLGVVLSRDNNANQGVARILLENQIDFNVVTNNDFVSFDTVIVPEWANADDAMIHALNAYMENGGKVLFCANALVKDDRFQIDCGLRYVGKPEFDCDYIQTAHPELAEQPAAQGHHVRLSDCDRDYILTDRPYRRELPNAPMLCNYPGHRTELVDGSVIAEIMVPYFSRTMGRFCGHKNTPHNKAAPKLPGIVRKGNVVYMAHPMATAYWVFGSLYQKRYFMLALEQLFQGGAFRITGLGSVGRATMIRQSTQNRYCLNLLCASPVRRGKAEVIEDILPVYNIGIELDVPETIRRAYEPLSGRELPICREGGKQTLTLPSLLCHTSIVLEY